MRDLLKQIRANIIGFDVYTLCVMSVYCVFAVIYFNRAPGAPNVLMANATIILLVLGFIIGFVKTKSQVFSALRRFYIIPVTYLMYDQVHVFVHIVNPVDYDAVLIAIDKFLFGVNPTQWLYEHVANPVLTEYLQLCYFLFYVMPVMHSIELWYRRDLDKLDKFARTMSFCYFISYVAYFAIPAIGPRFTVHDFTALNSELPGLYITPFLRDMVNVGGGIVTAGMDPSQLVNRDCMPSGHTWLTLVNIYLGFKFRSRFRFVFVIIGGSLIFSTIYLRYHYVVDIIVGALMALFTIPLEPYANKLVRRFAAGRTQEPTCG